eukprot:TRINITY_DN10162_c0_g1_i1.p1 TRINITY_DN10162_c0_g1~~TRINITY_DN10162_c0_g1_i1.p1  ORF type:complete len:658 (-),score=138.56 TRINITY_DN10162_c0_g1_i1:194-2167(-)
MSHFCAWQVSEVTDKGIMSLKFACADLHESIGTDLRKLTSRQTVWLHEPVAHRPKREEGEEDDEEEEQEEQGEEDEAESGKVEEEEVADVSDVQDAVADRAAEGEAAATERRKRKRTVLIRSEAEAWPMLHQCYVHGELSWVSTNRERFSVYRALCELGKLGVCGSLQELIEFAVPEPSKLDTVSAYTGLRSIMRLFWEKVYAHWLASTATKLHRGLVAFAGRRWNTARVEEPRGVEELLQAKGLHRKDCLKTLPMIGTEEEMAETYHVMEAGGVRDILRFTITAESAVETGEILDSFAKMRLGKEGMELESISNGFWDLSRVGKHMDMRLAVCTERGHSTPLLVEVTLMHKDYIDIKSNTDLLLSMESGPILEAKRGMRMAMSCKEPAAAGAADGNPGPEGGEAAALAALHAHASALPVQQKRFAHRTHQDAPDVVWCWVPAKVGSAKGGDLSPPEGALLRKTHKLDSWIELHWNGKPLPQTVGGIAGVPKSQGNAMSSEELGELLNKNGIDVPEAEHQLLALELVKRSCRFYQLSEESGGGLAKVTDFVVLKLFSHNSEDVLVKETMPRGPVTVMRKVTDSLVNCALAGLRKEVPDFIEYSYIVHDLEKSDEVWFTWVTPPGTQGMPAGNRYFLLRGTLKPDADPYHLLRATIGL